MMFWLMLVCAFINLIQAFMHKSMGMDDYWNYFWLAAFCVLVAFLNKIKADHEKKGNNNL